MLDQLRSNYTIKLCFKWNLLDTSNKYAGSRSARDLRTRRREIRPNAAFKKRACLIKQVTIAAADLQQIAAGQSAFGQIVQQAFERCSQRELLCSIAGVRVSACAAFIVR